jgi:hypothetical protein
LNDSPGTVAKPLAEPEDGHEIVVVLLGGDEIGNADPDVIDEPGLGQWAPPLWRTQKFRNRVKLTSAWEARPLA